jgi:hypothetical protein
MKIEIRKNEYKGQNYNPNYQTKSNNSSGVKMHFLPQTRPSSRKMSSIRNQMEMEKTKITNKKIWQILRILLKKKATIKKDVLSLKKGGRQ